MGETAHPGRSPYGERGLKLRLRLQDDGLQGRSPYGERGLKLDGVAGIAGLGRSLPSRGATIEIQCLQTDSAWR